MIKSVLIPTDGSENSAIATRYGLQLASVFGATVTGLHVVDIRTLEGPFLNDISGSLGFSPYQNYLPKFQEILDERAGVILERFQAQCREEGIDAKTKKETGIIPAVIAEEARLFDLVVIAQRGEHEKWSTGLLGSTTESVVRKSPRPVLVTPAELRTVKTVLVAYDGGVESSSALKLACENFSGSAFTLHAAVVSDEDRERTALADEVRECVQPWGVEIQAHCLTGTPGREILETARSVNADLIVMGAFGHSRIHDLILGSTTAHIMRQSPVPVLLHH